MTENVLNNIFESLSLDDMTAAETQLDEWFTKVTSTETRPDDEHEVVDSDEDDKFNVRNRRTGKIVGMGLDAAAAERYAANHGKLGPMEENDNHEVVDSDEDDKFNVRDKRSGKIVGMGMDADAAANYAKYHGNLPPIGEDAGDAGPKDVGPWIAAIKQVKDLFTSDAPVDASPEQVEALRSDMDAANVALRRFETGFPDQGLKKLRELGSAAYAAIRGMLPREYRDYMDANQHGGITTVAEEINTTRRCGECGEIDAAMAEDAEFCDQCIEEANGRNPDLMEAIDPALSDLMEQFKGFTVVDALSNKEGAQVGNADAIPVNDKSPVPNIKAAKRVGGAPVEIHADEHKGFEAEKAPAVKDAKVKNPAPKPEQGEFSDKLSNQEGAQVGNAGKISVNTVSPIGSKSRD